ncbi:hypothetical protein [Spongorhabdus nitratireducens]
MRLITSEAYFSSRLIRRRSLEEETARVVSTNRVRSNENSQTFCEKTPQGTVEKGQTAFLGA